MTRLWPRLRQVIAGSWMVGVFAFMLAPLVVVVGASFSGGERAAFIQFPPTDFTLRWYGAIAPEYLATLGRSLMLAIIAALTSCAVGIPAALGVVRGRFPGKNLVSAVFRAPLQIPAVVVGVSFLQLYYVIADVTDLFLLGSIWGLWIAHVFITTPYVIGSVVAVLQRFNPRLEEAALSLGASPWSTFRRVTLPVLMPGVYAGAIYAFMVSFSDLPVSLFLAGQGFKTFPVEIFQAMDYDFNPSLLAVATMIIVFSLGSMVLVQRAIGLNALLRTGGGK